MDILKSCGVPTYFVMCLKDNAAYTGLAGLNLQGGTSNGV